MPSVTQRQMRAAEQSTDLGQGQWGGNHSPAAVHFHREKTELDRSLLPT